MQFFSATIFGSEFSEHQKGPFNWEGKTAAFWEFTTTVDIINLATNRDTLTAAVVQVHFSSNTSPFSRHIVLESQSDSWTFDILTNKNKDQNTFFFSGSQVKVPWFFLKNRQKIFHPRLLLWNGKSWVQKGWGKVRVAAPQVAQLVAMAPELRSLGASQMDSRDHQSSVLDLSPTGVEAWMPFLWRGLVDG